MTFDLWHKYRISWIKRSLSFSSVCMYVAVFFSSLYFFFYTFFFFPLLILTMPGDARDIIPLFLYFEAMVADNWIEALLRLFKYVISR